MKRVLVAISSLVAVCVVAAALIFFVPVFKVQEIRVSGNVATTPADIEQASGIHKGSNLARVDVAGAARQVASLPWVQRATVQRSWPSAVAVEVTERQAVAYAKRSDGPHLIDAEGKVFLVDNPPKGAVEITGTGADDEEVMAGAAQIVDALTKTLPPEQRGDLKGIEAKSKFEYTAKFGDGRTVYFGSAESIHDKALAARTALTRDGKEWNVSNPELVTSK